MIIVGAGSSGGVWDWIASIPMANVIAVGAGIPGFLLAVWTFSATRSDTRRKDERSSQAERNKELRAQEQGILDWTKSELTNARQQIGVNETAYRKQLIETEDERDVWEARARSWYSRAHDMLGQLQEARHLIGNYEAIVAGLIARHIIPDPGLAGLQEDRPRLPARIDDIERDEK